MNHSQHGADADIFTANMYLAEDRVRPSQASLAVGTGINGCFRGIRFSAGSLSRNAADRGSFITLSRLMQKLMFPTP